MAFSSFTRGSRDAGTVRLTADTGQFNANIEAAERQWRESVGQMSKEALKLELAQKRLASSLDRYGHESDQAKRATIGLKTAEEQATRSTVQLDHAQDALRRNAVSLRRSFLGAAAAVGLGSGFAYALTNAVRTGLEFEREMRNVNSIAKLSDTQFRGLTKSVLALAGPSAQAPKTLAQGLYDLESSGFGAKDALTVLEASSKAATAGLTDNATATKAVAAALNAYHLPAEQARRVSDILFSTVDKGVLTFAELAQNMGDLVPAAAPLGVSLEEVGAAMATITLQGVPAAEAATRVNRSLILLAKPNEQLTALIKEQGFASVEAAVKARGYAGVLQIIDKATRGNVAATAKLAPEIRSLLGVVGLTGKNLKVYEQNLAAMTQAQEGAGRTAAVFAEQSKSTAFQLQRLSANVDVLKVGLAASLAPAINSVTKGVSEWLEEGDNMERLQKDINSAVATGAKVVKGLADGLRLVKDVAEPVVDALGGIEKAAQLALILGIAVKARRAALAFGPLQASSAATATKGVRDASVFGRAWDVATRPRALVVTTTPTGVPVPGGGQTRTPPTTTTPGRRFPFPAIGFNAPTFVGAAIGASFFYNRGQRSANKRKWDALTAAEQRQLLREHDVPEAALREIGWAVKPLPRGRRFDFGVEGFTARAGRTTGTAAPAFGEPGFRPLPAPVTSTRSTRSTRRPTDGLNAFQRLTLASENAELTADLGDDLKAARAIEAHYKRVAGNENLKGDALFKAKQDYNAARQRTQQIEDQIAQDRQQATEKATAKRKANAEKLRQARQKEAKERREALQERRERLIEDAEHEAALNAPPDLRHIADIAGQRAEAMARAFGVNPDSRREADDARRAKQKDAESSKQEVVDLRRELNALYRDFTTWQTNLLKDTGVLGGNPLGTHILEQLTREQTRQVVGAIARPRPGQRGLDEAVMGF